MEAFEEIPLAGNKAQAASPVCVCGGSCFVFARVDCCVLEGLTSKKKGKEGNWIPHVGKGVAV